MMTYSMQLARHQQGKQFRRTPEGGLLPQCEGDVALCQNLRELVAGELMATGVPTQVVESGDSVVGVDVRGEITTIFVATDAGELKIAGTLDYRNEFTACGDIIGEPRQGIKGCASVGAFVAFLLDDGSLYYLLWDYDLLCYRTLGALPGVPDVTIDTVDRTEFTTTVEGVTFKEAVADMRSGVPSEVTAQVGKKLEEAWQKVVEQAHGAGLWVQPVEVMLVYRMWDGQILHTTAPATVGVGYQGYDRLSVPLRFDATQGFVGTSDVSMRVKGYRISVDAERIASHWSDVIAQVEVWVSREQEVVMVGALPAMSQTQSGSNYYLSTFLPTYPQEDMQAGLSLCEMGRHSFYDSDMALQTSLTRTCKVTYSAARPVASKLTERVDCLHGRGDFLHVVKGLSLTTMRRGNPLSVMSTTESVGGKVYAMASQCIGGGAYTRQFVYLFTDHGIVALTHKADGSHANCRVISPAVVAGAALVATTSSGVYALSVDGTLLLIRDAKVHTLLTGLSECRQLGWNACLNELWLVPDADPESWQVSMVLQIYMDYRAYLSTTIPQKIVSSDGLLLYEQRVGDRVRLMNLSDEDIDRAHRPQCRWLSSVVEFDRRERPVRLDVGLSGDDVCTTISVIRHQGWSGGSESGLPLMTVTVEGKVCRPIALRALPGVKSLVSCREPLRCSVSVCGRFDSLMGLRFDTRVSP